ncbi:pyridoxamine 5'-phosphate oxidase [Terripilifer ovatus]|uniref:pyridoxamine 5'-phosphate oxidase n=1 Tax=Terripilifer ovatus TaxID=3032367 RepID=UPI003AB964C6
MNQLTAGDFTDTAEPFALFESWFAEAVKSEINDPSAMAVATVDPSGLPDVRMVLMKEWDQRGFVFYTNKESAKGTELAHNMRAAANFHWKSLRRQVRLRGPVEQVTDAESNAYFASRPRDARIGAWASQQSRPVESRFAFEKAIAAYTLKFGIGDVPRPDYWVGFRIMPVEIEFWHDRPFRLHDRITFRREAAEAEWRKQRLFP